MHSIIEDLQWRYATKKFDPQKKVSTNDIEIIKESIRLVPTSYGMQPYKVLIIENSDLKMKLLAATYNQNQVVDCSHLIVICSYIDIYDSHVDSHMSNVAISRNAEVESTKNYGDFLKEWFSNLTSEKKLEWNKNQCYIALGQLLTTCASLRLDSIPMEGFNAQMYDEILDLHKQNLTSTLICPIGYRSEEDHTQHRSKVRKELYEIIEEL